MCLGVILDARLTWYTGGSRMAGGSEAGVCGPRPNRRLSFSLGVHAIVFKAEIFAILACAKDCTERYYTREQIYIFSHSQAALQALESSRETSQLVWECQQAVCAQSNRNKVMLLWVPGHSGVQDNEDTDALATKGLSNLFLSSEPAIPILPCVGRLKIEWLKEIHSAYWAATPGMREMMLKEL
jgi:hypothetical protein